MSDYALLHGSGGIDMWLPWLKQELEKQTTEIWMPTLPAEGESDLKLQLPFLLQSDKITPKTIIIGHSAACPLILSFLEKIDFTVEKVVLVAGYIKPLLGDTSDPILQDQYDWEKIKRAAKEFVFVVSDNDPWGCDDKMNRPVFDQLGGTFVVVHNGGHFGSHTWKAPLYEFPLLLKLIYS